MSTGCLLYTSRDDAVARLHADLTIEAGDDALGDGAGELSGRIADRHLSLIHI